MRKKMICVMLIVVLLGVSLVAQADILMDATFTEPDAAANAVLEAGIASARDIWQEALGMTDEDMEYGGYMTSYVQVQYGEGQEHAWVITLRDRTGQESVQLISSLCWLQRVK